MKFDIFKELEDTKWVYDGAWKFENVPWQCYRRTNIKGNYFLLLFRDQEERAVVLHYRDQEANLLAKGEVKDTKTLDAFLKQADECISDASSRV